MRKLAIDLRDYVAFTKHAQSAKRVSNLLLGTPWGKGKSSADMEMAARLLGLIGGGAAGAFAGYSATSDDDNAVVGTLATLLSGGTGALLGSRGAGALSTISRGIQHGLGKSVDGPLKSPLLHGQIPTNDPYLKNLVRGNNVISAMSSLVQAPLSVPLLPITNQITAPLLTGYHGLQKAVGSLIPR